MQVITKTRTFLLYFFNISIIIINMITTIIDIFQYIMTYSQHVSLGMPVGTSLNPLFPQFTNVPVHHFDGLHSQGAGQATVVMSENTVLSKTVHSMK